MDVGALRTELEAMFEGRPHDLDWPHAIGWRPWWPMVSEVWGRQGKPPRSDGAAGTDPHCWAEAWAVLQRLHDEYKQAKK